MNKLCIDFGSGYNPKKGYKTCDVVTNPILDYWYDGQNTIVGLKEDSVDVFYLRNFIHHIPDLHKTLSVIKKYLKRKGRLVIIDCNKEHFHSNVILDKIWYRYVRNDSNIFISESYRDYMNVLIELGFKLLYYKQVKEKEITSYERN